MEIRKITAAERSQILDGYDYAFYEWQEDLLPNPVEPASLAIVEPDEILAAIIDNKIGASLRVHDFHQSIRGEVRPIGGIGGVWVYPEHRNRGVVRRLLQVAFAQMHRAGQVASMLIPFKPSFYGKFGYVVTNANLEVTLPIAAFLPYLEQGKKLEQSGNPNDLENLEHNWQWQRVKASESWPEFLDFMIKVAPKQHHGLIIPSEMPAPQWRSRLQKRQCILIRHAGELVAAAHYEINSDFRATNEQRLINIPDLYWSDLAARDMLFSFIARHREQVFSVKLNLPLGTNFQPWFGDVPTPLQVEISRNPYMVRVIDVVGAIANLPASMAGKLTIEVSDQFCDWNQGIYQIWADQGRLRCDRLAKDIKDIAAADVIASIEGISALVYGTLPIKALEHKGWVRINNPAVRDLITAWFPAIPLYNTVRF
ncbi:GCN5-related N-acetyltransferase [Thalassoporum mexicanum PCC 7367]|uniref:GNAT family N-acetyltransferase n=1 Tax=Thalassoporum mexicanum TaxID=3457544 RepID=UPI00029F94EF|nr:GNAT family N-acetyltransferase [Pseudanabaena sp. PCC 7367]AFY69202.1 GCN5-related N-acetyltransferase [Pseudanabaena sp. PCC 7367]